MSTIQNDIYPIIEDERPFDQESAELDARNYVSLVLPSAKVLNIKLLWQRRFVAVWDLKTSQEGYPGDFFLVGGDLPFLLLDKNNELTTVAEALTVYCWYKREWYKSKGDYLKEDWFHPRSWEPLDYWDKEHTSFWTIRAMFLEWHVLPKMIYDGELKCPDVIAIARRIGNDIYYQQLIDAGQFDKKPGK